MAYINTTQTAAQVQYRLQHEVQAIQHKPVCMHTVHNRNTAMQGSVGVTAGHNTSSSMIYGDVLRHCFFRQFAQLRLLAVACLNIVVKITLLHHAEHSWHISACRLWEVGRQKNQLPCRLSTTRMVDVSEKRIQQAQQHTWRFHQIAKIPFLGCWSIPGRQLGLPQAC